MATIREAVIVETETTIATEKEVVVTPINLVDLMRNLFQIYLLILA